MARFKLFPRNRRPSLGELLGISQPERQVSRKHHPRIVHDPMSPLNSAERHDGYRSEPMKQRATVTRTEARRPALVRTARLLARALHVQVADLQRQPPTN